MTTRAGMSLIPSATQETMMNTLKARLNDNDSDNDHCRLADAVRLPGKPTLIAVLLAMLLLSVPALSSEGFHPRDQPYGEEEQQALVALTDEPYTFDPGFAGGRWRVDTFAPTLFPAHPGVNMRGRKLVRLSNGDVVVAGLVPAWNQAASGTDVWNIGLVKVTPSGSFRPWGSSSAYHFLEESALGLVNFSYVVYPNLATPFYRNIRDIKVHNNRIYVLVDYRHSATDWDAVVVAFEPDGTPIGEVFATRNPAIPEVGGAMAFHNRGQGLGARLYVVGTSTFPSGRIEGFLTRLNVNSDGSLTPTVTGLGPGGNLPIIGLEPPANLCAGVERCNAQFNSLALSTRAVGLGNPIKRIYAGGALQYHGADWDFLAVGTDERGVPDASFGVNGYRVVPFNRGGNNQEVARTIVTRRAGPALEWDEVFLAGEVSRSNNASVNHNRGVGVTKLADNGGVVATFGNNGRVVYGGCSDEDSACNANPGANALLPTNEVWSMVVSGQRVAIAGAEYYTPRLCFTPPCSRRGVATFSVVRANGGALTEFTHLPLRMNGEVVDSYAWGVVADGPDSFFVAGAGGSPRRFITTRVSGDRIFGHGFNP